MTAAIALCCGEPAGIGPELAVKAWAELRESCPFVWIGDPRHLPKGTPVNELSAPDQPVARISASALPVLRHSFASPVSPGIPDPKNAQGVIDVIKRAVSMCQGGAFSAICTAPINKKVLIDGAGFAYPGHTEFLAALAGCDDVVMMLASDQLRVVPTTIHIALSQVPAALTPALLTRTIEITAKALKNQFAIPHPRIVVAGLNPHAGEGGVMGDEELNWIADLVSDLNGRDCSLTGPHPADTLFHAAARSRYDAAICMYHDQALIPIKTLDFDRGVNITLGLPFVRTSPDHGTAFDIAGRNIAKPDSLIEALRMAQKMASIT